MEKTEDILTLVWNKDKTLEVTWEEETKLMSFKKEMKKGDSIRFGKHSIEIGSTIIRGKNIQIAGFLGDVNDSTGKHLYTSNIN